MTQQKIYQQVLQLIVSDDVIKIDLPDKRLIVNGVTIPFPDFADANRHVKEAGGFSLESPCDGPLLFARVKGNGTLEIELPSSGIILRIHSEDSIVIKVRWYIFDYSAVNFKHKNPSSHDQSNVWLSRKVLLLLSSFQTRPTFFLK